VSLLQQVLLKLLLLLLWRRVLMQLLEVAAWNVVARFRRNLENVLSDFIFCSFTASKKPFPRICNSIFSQSPKIAFFVNGAFSKKI
jgi:hypothetical protein